MGDYVGCKHDPFLHYCVLNVNVSLNPNVPSVQTVIGECVPRSCHSSELRDSIPVPAFLLLATSGAELIDVKCKNEEDEYVFGGGSIVTVILWSIMVCLVIIGTYLGNRDKFWKMFLTSNVQPSVKKEKDGEEENSPLLGGYSSERKKHAILDDDFWVSFWNCFSVIQNFPRLLVPIPGNFGVLNGIRVLSMLWVILGHAYVFRLSTFQNVTYVLPDLLYERWTFQLILNATYSVDTFFLLSGFLVGYFLLKDVQKKAVAGVSWGLFYMHRFLRILPLYVFALLFFIYVSPFLGDGPLWRAYQDSIDAQKSACWTNILFLNNFLEVSKGCMNWTWFLANDMQFYVVAPIFIIFFAWKRQLGWAFLLLVTAICLAIRLFLVIHYDLGTTVQNTQPDWFPKLYIKPYARAPAFLAGIALAVVYTDLTKGETRRVILQPFFVVVNMVGAFILMLALLFSTYHDDDWDEAANDAWQTLTRFAWSVSVAHLTLFFMLGYGGIIRDFLSMRLWEPLARLTYGMVHLVIISVYLASDPVRLYYRDISIVIEFMGYAALSYAVSLFTWLFVEKPFMNLEALLLSSFSAKKRN
eukprot:CAMPEP_0177631156 /NCGR_PEP_ID=MMETSP0447-20121125/1596_1 /TAXON_ID=0 /ORGANISM="Stygamoeba regulata, Strain BSH-02190019" /LENGTH=583 /DNA_ID=CAMNT_0019132615 /DNA_START=161 /DNA_END=1912 /DNA_ORIENTATION=+